MRDPRLLFAVALGFLLAGGQRLGAQEPQVTIRLVQEDSGVPVAGAIVTALQGAHLAARRLTNSVGVAVVALAPGRYRFRVDRIGKTAWTSEMVVISGERPVLTLRVPATPIVLPDLVGTGKEVCRLESGSGGEGAAFAIWEEARKALLASVIARSLPDRYRQTLFTRRLSPDGSVLTTSTTSQEGVTARPFLARDPDRLVTEGYVRPNANGGYAWFGPDEEVLLSEGFLGSHCFRGEGGAGGRRELVGLAFRPLPDRTVPDITGVIWVERETGMLREVVFSYLNLPERVDFSGAGGRVVFERKDSGLWYVGTWSIRTPVVTRSLLRVGAIEGARRLVLTGYIEEGGSARPLP